MKGIRSSKSLWIMVGIGLISTLFQGCIGGCGCGGNSDVKNPEENAVQLIQMQEIAKDMQESIEVVFNTMKVEGAGDSEISTALLHTSVALTKARAMADRYQLKELDKLLTEAETYMKETASANATDREKNKYADLKKRATTFYEKIMASGDDKGVNGVMRINVKRTIIAVINVAIILVQCDNPDGPFLMFRRELFVYLGVAMSEATTLKKGLLLLGKK